MDEMYSNANYRARLIGPIIVAILALIGVILAAVISYRLGVYQERHRNIAISTGETHTLQFPAASGQKSATVEIRTYDGDVSYSLCQTKGLTGTVYYVQHKKANQSYWLSCPTVSISKNNVFTREFWLRSVTYGTVYNACIRKNNNFYNASNIDFDWLLSSSVPIW